MCSVFGDCCPAVNDQHPVVNDRQETATNPAWTGHGTGQIQTRRYSATEG
jgi:hypothetical protein